MSSTTPRQRIKDDISARALTPPRGYNNYYNLLWVHGSAGVGKTTIIQSVAEDLLPNSSISPPYASAQPVTQSPKITGASFFFSRKNQTTDPRKLFTNLAHDLARRNPRLGSFVQIALDATPGISNLSLREQCDALLIDPIRNWAHHTNEDHHVVMIVDGLDACDGGKSEHLKIINVIHQSFSNLVIDRVKWKWIISSRSEAWIRSAFNKLSSDQRVECISVPLASQKEVGDYICGSLQGIAGRAERLDNIRWHSGGYFAYAASLVAYIDGAVGSKTVRFRKVVTHSEHASFKHDLVHMFTQLDAMYYDILAGIPPLLQDLAKRILRAISITQPSSSDDPYPTAFMLSELLGITVEELHDALYYLHSVVTAPLKSSLYLESESGLHDQDFSNPELTFYHKSFNEFLRNPSRSRDWSIDVPAAHADLAKCCLKRLSVNIGGENRVYHYAAKRWFIHCWRTGMHSDAPNDVEMALGMLPELYEFNYTLLPRSKLVDRYFVEWLLWLQELAMSEYLVLNPGPTCSPEAPLYHLTTSHSTQRLPPIPTYILGLESSNQVLLVPTFEMKTGQRDDMRIKVLGPKEKKWDWIRGFKVVPLAAATQDISDDVNAAGERQGGEGSSGPHIDSTAAERGTNLGAMGGKSDYDELVARSLAWEEENIFGGFVSSEEEMAALVVALSAADGPSLSTDVASNEEALEGDTPGDATIEMAAGTEDKVATLPGHDNSATANSSSGDAGGSEAAAIEDDDTESYLSTGRRSLSGSEEMVVIAPQTNTEVAVGEDDDSDYELVEHEEALH